MVEEVLFSIHRNMANAIKKGIICWWSPLIISMPKAWCWRKNE
jgi:hypothetical protein